MLLSLQVYIPNVMVYTMVGELFSVEVPTFSNQGFENNCSRVQKEIILSKNKNKVTD